MQQLTVRVDNETGEAIAERASDSEPTTGDYRPKLRTFDVSYRSLIAENPSIKS